MTMRVRVAFDAEGKIGEVSPNPMTWDSSTT